MDSDRRTVIWIDLITSRHKAFGFFCESWYCGDDTIYYGNKAKGSITFWYPKGVDTTDPAEYMPFGEAWPWKKGQIKDSGRDYFSKGKDRTGKVVSANYSVTVNLRNHYLGARTM